MDLQVDLMFLLSVVIDVQLLHLQYWKKNF